MSPWTDAVSPSGPRSRWRAWAWLAAVAAACTAEGARAQPTVVDVGQGRVTLSSGATVAAELSGITFAGGTRYYAVGDDGAKSIWDLSVTIDTATGRITASGVTGSISAPGMGSDSEGIAFRVASGSVFISDEVASTVNEFALPGGTLSGGVGVPAIYAPSNVQSNMGLESLGYGAGGLWTANEEALVPDGPLSTTSAGSWVRIQRFSEQQGGGFTAGGQWGYLTDPISGMSSLTTAERSGVVDILPYTDTQLLVLERELGQSIPRFRSRLYVVDTSTASDVSALPSINGGGFTPLTKTLLWQDTFALTNFEGMTYGPTLDDGSRSLLLVSDNGGGLTQDLYALRVVAPVPEPATISLAALGVLGAAWWRRGRGQRKRPGIARSLPLLTVIWAGTAVAAPGRPNILFIFSDDHARHAISAYGSRVNQTPHLDRLAAEGARFLNSFVTNSICTPSRATLLTGQYSHRNGVPVFNRFDGSRDHVAKRLQAAGYHTGMIGKWHLGSDPTGFDRWIVLPGQGDYRDPAFIVPGGRLTMAGHVTELTTELGVEFIRTRPRDKPFFLMLHHKAPHRAWEPDERNRARFRDAVIPEPETLWDTYSTRPAALPENRQTVAGDLTRRDLKLEPPADLRGPDRGAWLNTTPDMVEVEGRQLTGRDLAAWKYQRYMQDYLACVQGVDDGVGRILDVLDETGLAADTIVIYTADNGWYLGDLGLYDKRFMYEPGLRTPLLVRGPGVVAATVPDRFVANIDLAPTFLDLAGEPVPESMQGRSIAPLLRGDSPADWRTSVYYRYYHDPGHHDTRAHFGVRTATHKLIRYPTKDAWEMFDLQADPNEQRNLLFPDPAAADADTAATFAALRKELERLQAEFGDDGLYADPATWPAGGVDGPFKGLADLGRHDVAGAIAASTP